MCSCAPWQIGVYGVSCLYFHKSSCRVYVCEPWHARVNCFSCVHFVFPIVWVMRMCVENVHINSDALESKACGNTEVFEIQFVIFICLGIRKHMTWRTAPFHILWKFFSVASSSGLQFIFALFLQRIHFQFDTSTPTILMSNFKNVFAGHLEFPFSSMA